MRSRMLCHDVATPPTALVETATEPVAGEPDADALAINGDPDLTDLLTRRPLGLTQRDELWFALAHEILGFERLGLIVSPSRSHHIASIALARTVAEQRGFEVELCELPESQTGQPLDGEQSSGESTAPASRPRSSTADRADGTAPRPARVERFSA